MRKVLSFVLVLALVLSSFSMAFAADSTTTTTAATTGLSDIAGNANEDAIQVNYDLGIVTGNPDGTFLPDKAVTRAEFAAMLTRALDIPDSALSGYTATSFKDTTGYSWAVSYLAFCQSKGILLGDGAGNVMPGRTITVNEAMTMALRAIGYTANSSLLVGTWPANYVSIAQNESLYDDVATTTTVNKASAAQIIYNLLTVQKVAVNSDGTTDLLWTGDKDKNGDAIASDLMNTNLSCIENDDEVMGINGYDYDNTLINITDYIGAYGDIYTKDGGKNDGKIVAFKKHDDTTLTGKVTDDGKFEVGTVDYDFGTNHVTSAAFFLNTDPVTGNKYGVTAAPANTTVDSDAIDAFAAANVDGGSVVTINADVSGKTIKDIYSVAGWQATTNDEASSDVQSDITDDHSLLGYDFAENDNDDLDLTAFALEGVTSLDKIAENNVVYVYTDLNSYDSDENIRKVAVGTQTVEGNADEISTDDDGYVTISGTEYAIAPPEVSQVTVADAENSVGTTKADGLDKIKVDSDGLFYLDAYGKIYDFDGSAGSADTYGVVKAIDYNDGYAGSSNDFDNTKVKLYKSDDSTTTYYFSETAPGDLDNMDWTTRTDQTVLDDGTSASALRSIAAGSLIGYALDGSGDIDTVNTSSSAVTGTGSDKIFFQSTKVLTIAGKSHSIDSDCVVFTYDDGDMTDTGSYDIASLGDVTTGDYITGAAAFITNDDGDVVALFVDSSNTKGNDYTYAVFNARSTTKNDSGDTVAKYTGFIDGTAFAYKSDDNDNEPAGKFFSVYKLKVDANNVITEINSMYATSGADAAKQQFAKDDHGGYIVVNGKVTDLSSDHTVVTVKAPTSAAPYGDFFASSNGAGKYTIADDAVVYKYDTSDKTFSVSKLSSLKDTDGGKDDTGCWVSLYDTKDGDADGVANLVVFYTK